jgi:hypothetical protein
VIGEQEEQEGATITAREAGDLCMCIVCVCACVRMRTCMCVSRHVQVVVYDHTPLTLEEQGRLT